MEDLRPSQGKFVSRVDAEDASAGHILLNELRGWQMWNIRRMEANSNCCKPLMPAGGREIRRRKLMLIIRRSNGKLSRSKQTNRLLAERTFAKAGAQPPPGEWPGKRCIVARKLLRLEHDGPDAPSTAPWKPRPRSRCRKAVPSRILEPVVDFENAIY